MPEGHTIHRLARDHRKRFLGQVLHSSSPQDRFRQEAACIDGLSLTKIEAHGKHLFYHWSDDSIVHVHLGLYGKYRSHRLPAPEPRGAVRWRVIGDTHAFDLNGPTACELVSLADRQNIAKRLGPDPLRGDAEPEDSWQRIQRSSRAIGALLLDQSVLAGVGNVYRAEVLFVHGIHPNRAGNTMSREEFDGLWQTITRFLKIGVKYNRIITADPATTGTTHGRMQRAERLLIYKKESCPRCDAPVSCWDLGARTIYACPMCQR